MASEIADSDGESDVLDNAPVDEQPNEHPTPAKYVPASIEHVSPPQINFDDYIDPTQTLSGQSALQNDGPGTGSTEKILRGLAHAQRNLAGSSIDHQTGDTIASSNLSGKRRYSAGEAGSSSLDNVPGKTKRVKTYGSKNRSGSTIDLYADGSTDVQPQPYSSVATGLPVVEAEALDHQGQLHGQDVLMTRERDRPRRVISLLAQQGNPSGHQVSTTTSSYGGYQSIEIDFRGGSKGLDVNANPFAGLSQASIDTTGEASLEGDVQNEMMTSPEQHQNRTTSASIIPAMLMQNDTIEAVPSVEHALKRRKTGNIERGTAASPVPYSRRATSVSAESVSNMSDKSQPKKRGRKSKSSKHANSSQQEAMAPPEVPEAPPSKRSRRETLDSSQVSHDETPSDTKRRRKKSKDESKQSGDTKTKTPSSDLHLDDEEVIGLPKENYKPRPSRRRSRQVVESEAQEQGLAAPLPEISEDPKPETNPDQSSPVKQPTSDLHLDDESVIGLPKENYKPRPSRRRSRGVAEDETAEGEATNPYATAGEAKIENTADSLPAAPSPSPAKTANKTKKSKVKRAKTSAAALLKKSSQMLSDGEDDVLWLDSKPAPVKIELPADLENLKKEENESKPELATPRPKTSISVEIPVLQLADVKETTTKSNTSAAAKKKRGRPKKSPAGLPPSGLPPGSPALDRAPTPEPLTDAEAAVPGEAKLDADADADADVEDEEDEDAIQPSTRPRQRAPLASKNPNALPASPISLAKLPPPTTAGADKENTPAKHNATVSALETAPTPSSTPTKPTGPTTHSPIRPPSSSAWNAKSKYRVGLSKRQSIPSLLRKVDKAKAAPTKVTMKIKERKLRKGENPDADTDDDDGGDGNGNGREEGVLRDKDGNLVEWEF